MHCTSGKCLSVDKVFDFRETLNTADNLLKENWAELFDFMNFSTVFFPNDFVLVNDFSNYF